MIVRTLWIAGLACSSLFVAPAAMGQSLPLGSMMNAIRSSQPAPQPGVQAQQPTVQRGKAVQPGGTSAKGRPNAGTFRLMRSKNRRLYEGRSEDNG
jgi:hypothetical protein